jgi:hypothetical protein
LIYAVKGRPGGGKSYYATRKVVQELMKGKCVVTNVNLKPDWAEVAAKHDLFNRARGKSLPAIASDLRSRCHLLDPNDADALRELFRVRVVGEKESRAVAVLDECHNWLNARMWNDGDRGDYVAWFTQHRKLGFDVYLLSQAIESIDAQIRRLIEYWVVLRNLKRWKIAGLSMVPVNLFIAITVWDGGPGSETMIVKREAFPLTWQKDVYYTMGLSHVMAREYDRPDALWLPRTVEREASDGCVSPVEAHAIVPSADPRRAGELELGGVPLSRAVLTAEESGERLGDEGDPADRKWQSGESER